MILVDPCPLAVTVAQRSLPALPGQSLPLPVRVERGGGWEGPVRVELAVPAHIRGVSCEAATVPAGENSAVLTLRFGEDDLGPFNMPILVRARLAARGSEGVAETPLDLAR